MPLSPNKIQPNYEHIRWLASVRKKSGQPALCSAIHINILEFRARVLASRLREGRNEEVPCADRRRCSSRTVFEEARTHTGLHIIEARRSFLWSDLYWWQKLGIARGAYRQLKSNSDGRHIGHEVARFSFIRH